MGKIKAISTSKIKKITAIKKNWREKGIRDEDLGSNPHSKGEDFSRSKFIFLETKKEIINKIKHKITIIVKIVKSMKIIYTKILDFMIGSQIYFLYYINN